MENVVAVIYQIIMLMIIGLCGFMLRRMKVLSDPVIKGVNNIIMFVGWPAMMFMVTQKESSPELIKPFAQVLIFTTVFFALTNILIFLFSKKIMKTKYAPVATMLAAMPNSGFIGLPIIEAVYDETGALLLAAVIVGFNLIMWTVCTSFYTGLNIKSLKGLLSPGFVAAVIGAIFFFFEIKLPTPLISTANQLGGLCTPLSMLLIGARMDGLKFDKFKNVHLWLPAAIKLLILPVSALIMCKLLNIDAIATGVIVVSCGMPAAAGCQMLAERYEVEVNYASLGVCLSTLLCVVTIPLLMLLL